MQNNSLTLKWVRTDGGASWFPTNAISAVAVDNGAVNLPPGEMTFIQSVEFDLGDGSGIRSTIDQGTVYILNAAGRTVDTIHLGNSAPR